MGYVIFGFVYLGVRLELILDDLVDCEVEGLFSEVMLLRDSEDDMLLINWDYFFLEIINIF